MIKKFLRFKELTNFICDRNSDIEVFGMYGQSNLGDEAMKVAALKFLPAGRAMATVGNSRVSLLDELIQRKNRKTLLVAGGTLIHGGDTAWLDYVEHRANQDSRLVFLGTGISFLESQISQKSDAYMRWSALLSSADVVSLRGPLSCATADKMGADASQFGDFAFLHFDREIVFGNHNLRSDRIGLNIGECLGNQAQHEQLWACVLKKYSKLFYIEFFIVTPSDILSTLRVIKMVGLDKNQYTIHYCYDNPKKYMKQVSKLKFFIGLKLHAAGLAMVAGTPTLMFKYKEKASDFVEPIFMTHSLIELTISADELSSRFDDLLQNPDKYTNTKAIEGVFVDQKKIIDKLFIKKTNN